MPEQNAQHSENRKNQGKPKEVPLLPEPIDIRCTKQFHAFEPSAAPPKASAISRKSK
jgi:hypothetical protein